MFEERMLTIDGKLVSILIDQTKTDVPRPPCFLIGLSSHYHDKFSEKFRLSYQLILLDLYWTDTQFSKEYIQSLDLNMMSDHIDMIRRQLLEQLGGDYEKIFLLAHSAYGFISVHYATKYKDNVRGIMNVASPILFDEERLQIWQEQYLNSNFSHPSMSSPTSRWRAYFSNKHAFSQQPLEETKNYFIDWYLSLGPLLWKNPILWKNEENAAAALWQAWEIAVMNPQSRQITKQLRDINMTMLFHFIKLINNTHCYDQLAEITVPVLWVIGLHDARVSLYHFEDYCKSHALPSGFQLFYLDGSHWPMFSTDSNTEEFDEEAIRWGQSVFESPHVVSV